MNRSRAALLAFVASFVIYLIPVAFNAHFIMPLGMLVFLPFLDSSTAGALLFVVLIAAFQAAAWLFFYAGFRRVRSGKGLALFLLLAFPPFALGSCFAMSATMRGAVDLSNKWSK